MVCRNVRVRIRTSERGALLVLGISAGGECVHGGRECKISLVLPSLIQKAKPDKSQASVLREQSKQRSKRQGKRRGGCRAFACSFFMKRKEVQIRQNPWILCC